MAGEVQLTNKLEIRKSSKDRNVLEILEGEEINLRIKLADESAASALYREIIKWYQKYRDGC